MFGKSQPENQFSPVSRLQSSAKFSGRVPCREFKEQDFEIMAELGFDFARIPMSYWRCGSNEDWYKIDEVVEFIKQYKIHINLNFHRADVKHEDYKGYKLDRKIL